MAWITTTERTTYGWDDVPSADLPTDREMKVALVQRLKENIYTQDAQIRVEVSDRVVVLLGEVETLAARRAAGEDAWLVPGTHDVSNQLSVTGG